MGLADIPEYLMSLASGMPYWCIEVVVQIIN